MAIAAALGVCCAVPLLASIGLAGAAAGVGIGSWLLVAVAATVAGAGFVRWRRIEPADDPELIVHPEPLRTRASVSTGVHGANDEPSL